MTGYQFIKRMTVQEISKAYGCSFKKAQVIKNMDMEGLVKSPDVCPQLLNLPQKYPCNFKSTECKTCMRSFLTTEIEGTEKITDGPCLKCQGKEFCSGYCLEREEYDKKID